MYKYLVLTLLAAILLAGCATEFPQAGSNTPDSTGGDSGLAGSSTGPAEKGETMSPSYPFASDGQQDSGDSGLSAENPNQTPVEPVTVDLGKITPEPPKDKEPVEMPAPGVPNSLVKLVHEVSMDLSQRLSIDIGEVQYVETEEMVWRDSSLGCPQAGMSYLQVLTDGFKITLEAQGQTYFYHTKGVSHFVLCVDGAPAP